MDLNNFKLLETAVTVVRSDIGMIARVGEDDQPVQMYEILLAKKNGLIVRAVGPRRSTTPVKIDLPIQWDAAGHEVDGVKYKFMLKSGVEIAPKSGKIKRVGKKGEGPTKLDLCRQIWKDNPNLPRKDMTAKFVSDAKCTPQGANTYYLSVQKENK